MGRSCYFIVLRQRLGFHHALIVSCRLLCETCRAGACVPPSLKAREGLVLPPAPRASLVGCGILADNPSRGGWNEKVSR